MTSFAPTGMNSDGQFCILQPTDSLAFDGSQLSGMTQSQISGLSAALSAKQASFTTGSSFQYLRGDLSLATFPAVPAAQVNSDWSASSGVAQILNKPPIMVSAPATRSIVTGTGATGFQVSSTRNVMASYSITITSTATIAGGAQGTVVLEIAPTNSATPSDWVEVGRFTNGQVLSLAIALQSVQTLSGSLSGIIPAGYYAKLRSINTTGTPTYAYNSGQENLL